MLAMSGKIVKELGVLVAYLWKNLVFQSSWSQISLLLSLHLMSCIFKISFFLSSNNFRWSKSYWVGILSSIVLPKPEMICCNSTINFFFLQSQFLVLDFIILNLITRDLIVNSSLISDISDQSMWTRLLYSESSRHALMNLKGIPFRTFSILQLRIIEVWSDLYDLYTDDFR